MIYELYPKALDAGMSISCFWGLSIGEVIDYIESRARIRERELKQSISMKHFLAKDIAQFVGRMFDDRGNAPLELWDFFPGLFKEERKEYEQEQKMHEIELYKAKMQDFAYQHNHSSLGMGGGS